MLRLLLYTYKNSELDSKIDSFLHKLAALRLAVRTERWHRWPSQYPWFRTFWRPKYKKKLGSESASSTGAPNSSSSTYNSGGFVQVIASDDFQWARGDFDLGLIHVGSLQTDNNWHGQLQALGSLDNTFGDDVTSHDASENVHQDSLYLQTKKKSQVTLRFLEIF